MKKIQFLFLILLFSCSSLNKSSEEIKEGPIEFTYEQNDENILFNVKNINKQLVYYVKKNVLDIEKYIEGEWVRVKILPCPCDAPCREINQEIEIKPNEVLDIKWDMIESWCGKSNGIDFVRETIINKVDKGRYKVKFTFKYEDGNGKILEFLLIQQF